MNGSLRWKLIAGFILVFIAGAMTGGLIATFAAHHVFEEWHNPTRVSQRMREHLHWELKLTPEQDAKIAPIIDKAAAQLGEIRQDTGRRVHETIMQAHRDIAANLTDEQRAKLKQMEEHHRRWHGHGPGGPSGPPPP